jgi:uncharacterized protein (DUF1800 family)
MRAAPGSLLHKAVLPLLSLGFIVAMVCPVTAQEQLTEAQALHFLNRATFGPQAGDIENLRRIGIDHWLDLQFHPDSLQEPALLQQRLAELPTLNESMAQLTDDYDLRGDQVKLLSEDQRKEYEKKRHTALQELTQAKILRGILSSAQLREVMVDFWYNHFNVFGEKNQDTLFVSSYERDAIRPHVFGKFGDLLMATASHPAMIVYLDNAQNTDPSSLYGQRAARNGKDVGINENYAREVMELHTLGVNGGYSQQDVTTLAHILTGWGLSEGPNPDNHTGFFFEPKRHDFANQVWLGYQIHGGGIEEVETVLNLLARHPSTAKHISYELAQYFVADQPPQSLVDKLTHTYLAYDGDMQVMLRTLFHSPEFWDAQYANKKFKPPFRFVISALRATNVVPPEDTKFIQGSLNQMGEPLYHCLTPNGYAATNDQWLNSDALLKRIDFNKRLSGYLDIIAGQSVYEALGSNWTSNTYDSTRNAEPKLRAAMLLSSPEFVYY